MHSCIHFIVHSISEIICLNGNKTHISFTVRIRSSGSCRTFTLNFMDFRKLKGLHERKQPQLFCMLVCFEWVFVHVFKYSSVYFTCWKKCRNLRQLTNKRSLKAVVFKILVSMLREWCGLFKSTSLAKSKGALHSSVFESILQNGDLKLTNIDITNF